MTDHRHVTRQLLLAARRGQITYRYLAEVLVERLSGLCPGCRGEAAAATAVEVPLEAYREPVARAVQVEADLRRWEEESRAAEALLPILRELSPEQRLLRVRNSPGRFANRALGEALLDQARACLPHDPAGSMAWAETAAAVAASYPSPHPPHDVLALALQGNARRAAGDFETAEELLFGARDLMVEQEVVELDVGAELHSLLGSLATDRRRFEHAAEHLEAAAGFYQTLGDPERLARVLMKLGTLHDLLQDLPSALEADKAACALLSPETDVRLYLAARFNYAYHLHEAGELGRARDVLDFDLDLFQKHADPHARVRFDWLEARLAAALGDPADGERGLLAVRDELAREGQGFDAAIACLHLAALYHEQGRHRAVAETAAQAVELFQVHALHREALAALLLLRDAAAAGTLTAEAIFRVAAFLRDAEGDPGARLHSTN